MFSGLPSISVGAGGWAPAVAGAGRASAQMVSRGRIERGTGGGPSLGLRGGEKLQRAHGGVVAVYVAAPRSSLSSPAQLRRACAGVVGRLHGLVLLQPEVAARHDPP